MLASLYADRQTDRHKHRQADEEEQKRGGGCNNNNRIVIQPIAENVSPSAFTFTIILTIIFQYLYQHGHRAGTNTEKVGL
jgi:hypothetical protein